jgi:hypothetical protein
VNNEFDRMWKEAVMALFKDMSRQLLVSIAEYRESISIFGVLTKI